MTNSHNDTHSKLQFLCIDSETRQTLRTMAPLVEKDIGSVLESFYGHITVVPELRAMLGTEANIAQVQTAQAKHWSQLFQAEFDDAYRDRARRIGEAHHRHNLNPTWYLGGYCFALNALTASFAKRYRWKPQQMMKMLHALNKAVFMDIDCAIEVYNDAILRERKSRQDKIETIISDFDQASRALLLETTTSGHSLTEISARLTAFAETTNQQAGTAASAGEQAASNVQAVSSAAEQLSSSIAEISRQIEQSSTMVNAATQEANNTRLTMQKLAESAESIGHVVILIRDIAEQTNLLALNATIEAARAGEAGKGFAVVASEVKSLANQTAKATDEIAQQIGDMQGVSKSAAEGISSIGRKIEQLNEVSSSIATAMTQQQAATAEIARNVHEAAKGTADATAASGRVTQAASESGLAAQEVHSSASTLLAHATELRAGIERFFNHIKTA